MAVEIPQRPRLWRYFSPANAPDSSGRLEFHVQPIAGGLGIPDRAKIAGRDRVELVAYRGDKQAGAGQHRQERHEEVRRERDQHDGPHDPEEG